MCQTTLFPHSSEDMAERQHLNSFSYFYKQSRCFTFCQHTIKETSDVMAPGHKAPFKLGYHVVNVSLQNTTRAQYFESIKEIIS